MQMDMISTIEKSLVIADTIEGLFLQTDEDWSAIIIADVAS